MIKKLQVTTQTVSYPIYLGGGLLDDALVYLNQLPNFGGYSHLLLISNETVFPLYGTSLEAQLQAAGKQFVKFIIPDGEEYKTWGWAEKIISHALKEKLPRQTLVIALGGGVVGDLAGFVAAVYMRGLPFVQIPTTLLAQVDSSVGGKVAVNHVLGKNMIGAFYHPQMVLADLKTLATLPRREWLAGLAEVIKYGLIWDKDFFAFLQDNRLALLDQDPVLIGSMITRCCEIKSEIVGIDEKEQGLRAILNFGHTVGHALERATDYKVYRHGEAVAVGMAVAVRLAELMEFLPVKDGEIIIQALASWGFAMTMPLVPQEKIIEGLAYDKKAAEGKTTFVLPRKIGLVDLVTVTDHTLVAQAINEV